MMFNDLEVVQKEQLTCLRRSISERYALLRMSPGEIFSANLKQLREAAGLTQEQMAARMGIRQSAVSNLESGNRGLPSGLTLVKLAAALNCSTDALLRGLLQRQEAGDVSPGPFRDVEWIKTKSYEGPGRRRMSREPRRVAAND